MRLRAEKLWIEFVMRLDVFLRENRVTGRNLADERQAHLLTQRVLELDAARGARQEFEHALALQGPQVFFSGIGRLEPELPGNFGARRWHAGFGNKLLNHLENLLLSGGQFAHLNSSCINSQYLGLYTVSIAAQ